MGLFPCKCVDLNNRYIELDKLLHTYANLYALSRKETDRSLYFKKLKEFNVFVTDAQQTIKNCSLHLISGRLFLSRCSMSIFTIYETDDEIENENEQIYKTEGEIDDENDQMEGHEPPLFSQSCVK